MLWAMCHGGDMEDGDMGEEEGQEGVDEFDWVMKVPGLSAQCVLFFLSWPHWCVPQP